MHKISILLVIEREDAIHRSVSRALMFARYLNARLSIMFCDIAGPSMRPRATAMSGASDDAREYLQSLRNYIIAPDIEITTEAAFEGTVAGHVLRKLTNDPFSLVIKSVSRTYDAPDMQPARDLIRSSQVPVLLTHGEPWHPVARFAAAVDLMNPQSPKLPDTVVETAESLRGACGAELDLVYVRPAGPPSDATLREPAAQSALQALARQAGVDPGRAHIIAGDFVNALPRFALHREYDLIALGAACTAEAPDRGLLEQLLRLTVCDLLFVKPLPVSAVRARWWASLRRGP
jgi:nucleotide-binding universal stress UspA family protein